MVGPGEPAHFECAVDANPLTPHTIKWEGPAPNYDMDAKTKTTAGAPAQKSGPGRVENVGVVLLTVLNATKEDSGPFTCVARNGIGTTEVRNGTFLLVRRKSVSFFIYTSDQDMNMYVRVRISTTHKAIALSLDRFFSISLLSCTDFQVINIVCVCSPEEEEG